MGCERPQFRVVGINSKCSTKVLLQALLSRWPVARSLWTVVQSMPRVSQIGRGPVLLPSDSHSSSQVLFSELVDLLAANWISQQPVDTGTGVSTNF